MKNKTSKTVYTFHIYTHGHFYKQLDIKNNRAITLMALVITIIVVLILSSISISMITGDNSIIKNALTAKENSITADEREIIEKATIQAIDKNKYGDIEEEDLKNVLNNLVGIGKTKVSLDNQIISSENSEVDISDYVFEYKEEPSFLVEFIETSHIYSINSDGTITDCVPSNSEINTDWEKINYEIRTDENDNQYYAVTGLKSGISKTSITIVNIAKKYKGIDVTSIENQAFNECTNVISVTIPNGIKTIETGAFRNCKNITELVIPDSVTEIYTNGDWGAFSYCTSLEEVKLGKNVTNIGNCVFVGCSNLKHINIPNSVTGMGRSVFSGCTKLTKAGVGLTEGIELEDGISIIQKNMFVSSNLEEITIPSSVTKLGEGCFRSCKNLREIVIPDSVTELICTGSWGVFSDCTNLESVTFGSNVTKLGNCTFDGCTSLEHIKIPSSITTFGTYTFRGCTQLTKAGVGLTEGIELEPGITKLNKNLFYGSKIEEITIPNTVTIIEKNVFNECKNLLEIIIPNSVTTIEGGAFRYCEGLTEIIIPNSVTSMTIVGDWGTFQNCINLQRVTLSNNITTITKNEFQNCTNLETVVYKGSSHTTETSLRTAGITSIGTNAFSGTKITE